MVIDMYICQRPLGLQVHSITITASSCVRSLVYMYMNIQTDIVRNGHGYIYIYNYIICTHTYTYTCIYRTHGHIYTYTYRYMYVYVCVCIIFNAIVHQSEFHMNIFTTCFIHAGVRPRSLIRPPRQPGYRTRSVCVQARDACDPKFFSIVGYLDLGSMDVQNP